MSSPESRTSPHRASLRVPTRAVLFDAGHTLLEMDYAEVRGFLWSRGHRLDDGAVVTAERRARIRLEEERARQTAGLAAVLFDPGGLWGDRDCLVATSLEAAVDHAVARSQS